MILALSVAVSGCSTTQAMMSECLWTSTIQPTFNDVTDMSDHLVGQILNHNDKYKEFCT